MLPPYLRGAHRTDGRWAAPVPVTPTRLPSSVSSTGPNTCHLGLDWLTAGLVAVPGSVHTSVTERRHQTDLGRPPAGTRWPRCLSRSMTPAGPARPSPGCSSGTSGTSHKCCHGSRGGRRIHILAGFAYFYPGAAAFGAKDAGRRLRRPEQPAVRAAAELVEGNYPNEQIIALVLSSPPGAKAQECDPDSPARWVQQKTDSAVARYGLEQFYADRYWRVAHTAGLTPHNFRVLDCTATRSPAAGRVSAHVSGQDRNRLAMVDPDDRLRTLQALGWDTVVSTPDRGTGLTRN